MDPFRDKQRDMLSIFWTFGCHDGRKEVANMDEWLTVGLNPGSLYGSFLWLKGYLQRIIQKKEKRMELWKVILLPRSRTAFPLVLPLGTRPLSCLAQGGITIPSGNLAIISLWRECWVQKREWDAKVLSYEQSTGSPYSGLLNFYVFHFQVSSKPPQPFCSCLLDYQFILSAGEEQILKCLTNQWNHQSGSTDLPKPS